MKNFVLGVVVGIVADRVLVNSVSNEDVVSEIRRTLKTLDDRLANVETADKEPGE